MDFTLFYRGVVKSRATKDAKHSIRKYFGRQLAQLCKLPPLRDHPKWFRPSSRFLSTKVGDNVYYFLVARSLEMYAELRIKVLVPPSGRSFRDIDNKLKVICDALSVPSPSQIPMSARGERAVYCLLENDELVYQLTVDTDYLLTDDTSSGSKDKTLWVIHVILKGNRIDPEYHDLIV
jgi:hypothetical protein